MIDDNKKTSSDDEYQFPQEEYVTHNSNADNQAAGDGSSNEESARPNGFLKNIHLPQMRNKRIILVIAVVIIAIIFIRIMNSDRTAQVVKPAVVAQPVVQPQDNDLLSSLNSLQGHSSQTETKLQALQSQIADMQNKIDQSRADNQQLHQTVTDLSSQMEALTVKVDQILAQMTASGKIKPAIVFHLRAVVPDRAWITSGTETMTVTVGDNVKGYGTVRAIDATNGIITTSSGRKIIYGKNDY